MLEHEALFAARAASGKGVSVSLRLMQALFSFFSRNNHVLFSKLGITTSQAPVSAEQPM
jgi:hypothetical protein